MTEDSSVFLEHQHQNLITNSTQVWRASLREAHSRVIHLLALDIPLRYIGGAFDYETHKKTPLL
jgi:hypothetical protein